MHRWTAEEGRHGIVMRDYLLASRAVDPDKLERSGWRTWREGFESDNRHSMLHSVAYVAFQELATRVSHRNTGHQSGDPVCDRMLARIATDENLHMVFYRNLLKAAFELAPDLTMQAVRDVVVNFRMPGHGMPGFERAAAQMAIGEIYNLRIHHDDVLQPVLRHLKVLEIDGLGPEGLKAQEELGMYMGGLDAEAVEVRREARGPQGADGGPRRRLTHAGTPLTVRRHLVQRRVRARRPRGGGAVLSRARAGNRRPRGQWEVREVRRRLSRSFSERPPQTPKRSSLLERVLEAGGAHLAHPADALRLAHRAARLGKEEVRPGLRAQRLRLPGEVGTG